MSHCDSGFNDERKLSDGDIGPMREWLDDTIRRISMHDPMNCVHAGNCYCPCANCAKHHHSCGTSSCHIYCVPGTTVNRLEDGQLQTSSF